MPVLYGVAGVRSNCLIKRQGGLQGPFWAYAALYVCGRDTQSEYLVARLATLVAGAFSLIRLRGFLNCF